MQEVAAQEWDASAALARMRQPCTTLAVPEGKAFQSAKCYATRTMTEYRKWVRAPNQKGEVITEEDWLANRREKFAKGVHPFGHKFQTLRKGWLPEGKLMDKYAQPAASDYTNRPLADAELEMFLLLYGWENTEEYVRQPVNGKHQPQWLIVQVFAIYKNILAVANAMDGERPAERSRREAYRQVVL